MRSEGVPALPEATGEGVQSTAHIQEPLPGSYMVSADRQHFRVQAKLGNLLSTRPREGEKLRQGLTHQVHTPFPATPLPGESPSTTPTPRVSHQEQRPSSQRSGRPNSPRSKLKDGTTRPSD